MGSRRTYRVHEFAELAGVTVKALHHYDRLGLLAPHRTASRYRVYTEEDLGRLEQIVALKFLGLPLRQIKDVLERTADELPAALRTQRKAIEAKQAQLARAVQAIRAAEESLRRGASADPSALRKIIEVVQMENSVELMKKYYSEDAWEKRRRYYDEGPAPEWLDLYRDANALLGTDPSSSAAQDLADRWLQLSVRAYAGDPAVQTDSPSAWLDRKNWPAAMKHRLAEYNLEAVQEFVQQAGMSARKKYFSDAAWLRFVEHRARFLQDTEARTRFWQARLDLFHDVEALLHENPKRAAGQSLARRWVAQLEEESRGDAGILAGLMRAWTDRRHWSGVVRWYMEGLVMMSGERFDRVADYLDAAHAACLLADKSC